MRITSKGQVTIPQEIREAAGLMPATEVEFSITKSGVLLKKVEGKFGDKVIEQMRGRADKKLSTDQIMALTRS